MAGNWFTKLFRTQSARATSPKAKPWRPRVELLEDRVTPISSVTPIGGGVTAATMVQSLLGNGVQATNINYTGNAAASGTFSGGQSSIGFDKGIVLTSGDAVGVLGPNNTSSYTGSATSPGDSDLDQVISPNTTNDASVLEFDFVPSGSVLNFKYVFSSEEYEEFVGSSFNDVFAFFLNGQNVALIPGTNTPVSINTVNNGDPSSGVPPTNPQFFIDNYTSPSLNTQMDGLTVVLTVKANVNAGQTNHIKLAIADAADSSLDSAVFIQAGSFSAPQAPKIKTYNPVRFVNVPGTRIYSGQFTLVNIGTAKAQGPLYMLFIKLPQGASIANAKGTTAAGVPYIKINKSLGVNQSLKVTVKIYNPLLKPLSGFFSTKNLKYSATDPGSNA